MRQCLYSYRCTRSAGTSGILLSELIETFAKKIELFIVFTCNIVIIFQVENVYLCVCMYKASRCFSRCVAGVVSLQNPGYMGDSFKIMIETFHAPGAADNENVSGRGMLSCAATGTACSALTCMACCDIVACCALTCMACCA